MEIRQVQSFVHVARLGSFSRAAETMGYSQSAITVQIRLLEEELGTKLFDRMGKKVSLTPQGKRFLEHANRILYEMNRTIMAMNEDRELENPLHIGTIESLCTAKFPRILSQFHTLYPKVNIQITLDSPEKLIRMMEHNELDLVYILDTPRWDKNWIKVMEKAEPVIFLASKEHPLAGREKLQWKDICLESFFLTERNANYRQALDQHLALMRQTISPVLEISDTAFIIRMLEESQGLSFLPLFAVEDDIEKGRIARLDVEDIDIVMYRQIFYHKNKFKTQEMEKFIQFAREEEVNVQTIANRSAD